VEFEEAFSLLFTPNSREFDGYRTEDLVKVKTINLEGKLP